MKLSKIALAVATMAVASSALAHGYIESPASRAYMCKLGQNIDCGSVQYEPQSVEKTSGFPTGALPDRKSTRLNLVTIRSRMPSSA